MATQPEIEHPRKAFGWAARDPSGVLSPFNFSRRFPHLFTQYIFHICYTIFFLVPLASSFGKYEQHYVIKPVVQSYKILETGEKDVAFKVLYCGICHSDLHMAKNEWGFSTYPLVPGHEIVGVVTEVGSKVQKFKVGDKVGVGCLVDSCRTCQNCFDNLENYCPQYTLTYGAKYKDGSTTYGGYSDSMVADEHFVVRIPDGLPLDAAAPLLCAGITVYSPLRYFALDKPGLHVGVVGLGGLGHLAVKFAKAFGAKVTVISTSPNKKDEAIQHLGADSFLISRDQDQMQAANGTLDGIIDTVSATHPLLPLIGLLKYHGKLVMVGAPEKPLELPVIPLIMGKHEKHVMFIHVRMKNKIKILMLISRKIVAGSGIGGMKETQEMIDFAAEYNVKPDIEVIPVDYVNTAMERLLKSDI
ncbi:putative mannitol dehydrogenase, partial [Mucuna pruriens]